MRGIPIDESGFEWIMKEVCSEIIILFSLYFLAIETI